MTEFVASVIEIPMRGLPEVDQMSLDESRVLRASTISITSLWIFVVRKEMEDNKLFFLFQH